MFNLSSLNHPRIGKPGLPAQGAIRIARGAGKFGDALSFDQSNTNVVFFQAEKNLPYSTSNWGGTVSFWLKLDPDTDLAPGFCDPFQITSRQWNDAAMWVDFSKDDKPRHFRFGAFADRAVWDPKNRDLEATPMAERPMVTVMRPPFTREKWTQVVLTFEGFNTGKAEGQAGMARVGGLDAVHRQGAHRLAKSFQGSNVHVSSVSYLQCKTERQILPRPPVAS